ncbi:Mg-protoporphyrin IX monomethylester oxidative cyclase [Acaryochloris thomasi RCC1774]|uniref:Magnesium-protoporphyrin IX monomethyl ester [oxidative] cyclase n=1 Tax=Acaryochloris thomasi RCC1774 TaxID=1764569 RepID=A0A2W1K5J9_9CYAN|nr:magnesium-protoporphyrin IX monomethyl ester (oxidative) cyclase [Acaryochloris thomasi]PZD75151.1 Mg-protoporphyrin IX monomethylester oxidative cyclase [Acaryochloris thomasi RCC1774]
MISTAPEIRSKMKPDIRDTLLTPRFWTTDFQELELLDTSVQEPAIKAVIQEFIADYNRKHFVRDDRFDHSFEKLSEEERKLFLAFLERSCTSEFSGFLLYKEASLRLRKNNPLLAEGFKYLSRDEARHAGFINRAMADSGLSLDLPHLTKFRKYTLIKPKFLFYATYLSEKIGYWKYILIFQHLEDSPEFIIHPLFNYFDNWCQDESRHGDFMGLVIKSQADWLNGTISRLQIRLFLLLFVLTTYFSGQKSSDFYNMIGMDVKEFDLSVLKKTNKEASKVFPIYLDLEHPQFVMLLDACVTNNKKLRSKKKLIGKLPFYILNCFNILRMYFIPIKESLPTGTVC